MSAEMSACTFGSLDQKSGASQQDFQTEIDSADRLNDADQIERAFAAIAAIRSTWKQELALYRTAKYFDLGTGLFKRMFKAWQQELKEQQYKEEGKV